MTSIPTYNSRNWKPRQQSVQAIKRTENDKKREQEAKEKWMEALNIKEEACTVSLSV